MTIQKRRKGYFPPFSSPTAFFWCLIYLHINTPSHFWGFRCSISEGVRMVTFIRRPQRYEPGCKQAGDMKEECVGEALFEDPDFPSEDTSLFCDSSTPIARLQGNITWLRPQVRPSTLGKSQ